VTSRQPVLFLSVPLPGAGSNVLAAAFCLIAFLAGCGYTTTDATHPSKPEGKPSVVDEMNRMIERRAVEAVIWGMPAVNYDLMLQAAIHNGVRPNQIAYWSRLSSWKNQTLTPNPDALYFMPFYNVKDGPVVLEIPPAGDGTIVGSVDDCWQTALEDVGPAGADKGKGGKYLILPPDMRFKMPAGYIPLQSSTYQGYALLRSILKTGSDADIANAVAYGKRIKMYPLSQESSHPETKFVDVIDDMFDATIPYDPSFFESLNRIVQAEPWLERDKAMIDQLKSLGIEKGKPYQPEAAGHEALEEGIDEAHRFLDAGYQKVFVPPFNEGTHWALPVSQELVKAISDNYTQPDVYPVDARGIAYSIGFFSAKHLGAGQFYLMEIVSKDAKQFDGGENYRLTVPPNAPVNQYWSATVYDRATHALIKNMSRASRSSQNPELQKNADGSVDVYFGPKAPKGKESNWIPTEPKGHFEVLFRFYGPEKSLFDKTWKLPDIERVP